MGLRQFLEICKLIVIDVGPVLLLSLNAYWHDLDVDPDVESAAVKAGIGSGILFCRAGDSIRDKSFLIP
jgi:hypothetical protein